MLRIFSAILLIVLSVCFSSCNSRRSDDDVIVLRLGHGSLPGKPLYEAARVFKEAVERRAGGRVRIDVYPQSQIGDSRLLVESVAIGTLAMCCESPLSQIVPEMAFLDLPYIFYDSAHVDENLDGAFGQALGERARSRGLVVLGYYPQGARYIFNRRRNIHTPGDLQGLKIRVPEGRIWIEMMNRFGALATPLSWGEVYTAIEQGVIDGAETDPISLHYSGLYECCKYVSRTDHIRNIAPHVINLRLYESLPAHVQQLLHESAREATQKNRQILKDGFQDACASLETHGVSIVDVKRTLFEEKVRHMRDKLAQDLGAEDLVALLTHSPKEQ